MKVQRLIEKYKKLEGVWDAEGAELARQIFLQDLEQLDEPETVKIPQMVADWIDVCKDNLAIGLYIAMNPDFLKQWNKNDELICWIRKISNQELFARAWLGGYEVEQEKRYKIYIKSTGQDLFNNKGNLRFMYKVHADNTGFFFTKSELEENSLGWVFDCPGIEIEEVKE